MSPIHRVDEVFTALQEAKARATDLHTNFFPVQTKLQDWIARGELFAELRGGVAFFFRTDRDFQHLYFCAPDRPAWQREMDRLPALKTERVVTDLVGKEASLTGWLPVLEATGFRRHLQLQRLSRPGLPGPASGKSPVLYADPADGPGVLGLIESSFDRYGEQLPTLSEIEAAIERRPVLLAKHDGAMAGLLYFETHGVASTIRFWVVAEKFRGHRVGATLMQHYFQTHAAVRRFTLWVNSNNENALSKYRHYGYAPDGLVDQVLANEMINL